MCSHCTWPGQRCARIISWWNFDGRELLVAAVVPQEFLSSIVLVADHDSVSTIQHHRRLRQHWSRLVEHLSSVHGPLEQLLLLWFSKIIKTKNRNNKCESFYIGWNVVFYSPRRFVPILLQSLLWLIYLNRKWDEKQNFSNKNLLLFRRKQFCRFDRRHYVHIQRTEWSWLPRCVLSLENERVCVCVTLDEEWAIVQYL